MKCYFPSALLHFFTVETISFYFAIGSHFDLFKTAFYHVKTAEYGVAALNGCFDGYAWEYIRSVFSSELEFTCSSGGDYLENKYTEVGQHPMLTPMNGTTKWKVDMQIHEQTSPMFIIVGFLVPVMVIILLFWSAYFVFCKQERKQGTWRWQSGRYIVATWELEFQWPYKVIAGIIMLLEVVTQLSFFVMMMCYANVQSTFVYLKSTFHIWVILMVSLYKITNPSRADHPYVWKNALCEHTVRRQECASGHFMHFLTFCANFITSNDQLATKFSDALEHAMHGRTHKLKALLSSKEEAQKFLDEVTKNHQDETQDDNGHEQQEVGVFELLMGGQKQQEVQIAIRQST